MFSSKSVFSSSFLREFFSERFTIWIKEWGSMEYSHNCCWFSIPSAARDQYIESEYRPVGTNFKNTTKSLFRFHNETLNIWTHIFAAFYFIGILYRDMDHTWDSDEQFVNLIPCFAFSSCLVLCFLASAFAHWYNCVSVTTRKTLFVIDYAGIGFNALGAGIAYTAYMPEEFVPTSNRNLYSVLIVVMVTLATTGCSIAMVHLCKWPGAQSLKAASFGFIALQGNLPMIIYLRHLSTDTSVSTTVFHHYWCYCLFKLISGFFLASHIPERFFPRVFDVFGQSHTLFHITGFFTVLFQYKFAYSLSSINPTSCTEATRWRVLLTLIGAAVTLTFTVMFFRREIRNKKELFEQKAK